MLGRQDDGGSLQNPYCTNNLCISGDKTSERSLLGISICKYHAVVDLLGEREE